MYSTMAPYVGNRSTNRKKKSQSYVIHGVCYQLGIVEHLAPTLIEAELIHFVSAPIKIV